MDHTPAARVAAIAAGAVLVLAGCASATNEPALASEAPVAAASSSGQTPSPRPADTSATASPTPTADASVGSGDQDVDVPEALRFEATLLADGAPFDGASLAGQDALIWIWAPWCPVCQAEAPDVAAAAAELPDGVAIYGLPGKADAASSQAFVEDYALGDFPHIFSEDGSVWERFGITYQPALVLVNEDGVVEAIPGSMSKQDILDAARALAAD